MSNWSNGYVDEIEYTYGYYAELNPERMTLPFLNYGVEMPRVQTACELGFGQGISTNFHATGSKVSWYGNDFNPSQAVFAKKLALAGGNGAELTDESFEEFCSRSDLPNFDFIALHGIWSWISDQNREIIVDFISRKLNLGGVLYVSYNTLPGWSGFSPLRRLMIEHAANYGVPANRLEDRIQGAINFSDKLFDLKSRFTETTHGLKERFDRLKAQDKNYLAHEYFNKDWQPMFYKDMQEWLSKAKLDYVCSANYLDAIDTVNLTEEQQEFLNELEDINFKETIRDFMTNQQFRKDYWIKGKITVPNREKVARLRAIKIILCASSLVAPEKVNGLIGEATLQKDIYQAIVSALADRKPHSIAELESVLAERNIKLEMILQAVFILTSLGNIATVPDEKLNRKDIKKLNEKIITMSKASPKVTYLLSPITGAAVMVTRFNQLFIEAISSGHKKPEDWALYVCKILSDQNQKILKDGQALNTFEENLAELIKQAKEFQKSDYPALCALGLE